jgi:integrase/recombinase XerD
VQRDLFKKTKEELNMPREYLEPSDVVKLEEAATNLRDRLLIRLLFHLGCRVSEELGIQADDIDLGAATVRIEHLKTRLQSNCPHCRTHLSRKHAFCPACGEKVESVVNQAKAHRRMRVLPLDKLSAGLLGHYIDEGGLVDKDGKKMLFGISRHRAWQIVKECADRAGLPKLNNPETGRLHYISPHRLRDAFAVHAMKTDDSGEGMRMLQEHLGHASFNTTARYRKISGEEQRAWYNRLWGKNQL